MSDQCRVRALRDRQGNRWPCARSYQEAGRQLHRPAGLHDLQRGRRRHRLRARMLDVGALVRGLREEDEVLIHRVGVPAGRHRSGGALQHGALRAFVAGAHRRDYYVRLSRLKYATSGGPFGKIVCVIVE